LKIKIRKEVKKRMDDKEKLEILWKLTKYKAIRQKIDLNPRNFLRELGNISTETAIDKKKLAELGLELLHEIVNDFEKVTTEKVL
jgi:hypothetical protein